MSYMTISSQENHNFSLCSFFHAHPTTLLLKILGRTNAWAVPPPQILGGPSPQSPLGLRPCLHFRILSKGVLEIRTDTPERLYSRSSLNTIVSFSLSRSECTHRVNTTSTRMRVQLLGAYFGLSQHAVGRHQIKSQPVIIKLRKLGGANPTIAIHRMVY